MNHDHQRSVHIATTVGTTYITTGDCSHDNQMATNTLTGRHGTCYDNNHDNNMG